MNKQAVLVFAGLVLSLLVTENNCISPAFTPLLRGFKEKFERAAGYKEWQMARSAGRGRVEKWVPVEQLARGEESGSVKLEE